MFILFVITCPENVKMICATLGIPLVKFLYFCVVFGKIKKLLFNFFIWVTAFAYFCKNLKLLLLFKNPASFCLFSIFSQGKYSKNLTLNYKSKNVVLGTQTEGGRIVGTDESSELWWPPFILLLSPML